MTESEGPTPRSDRPDPHTRAATLDVNRRKARWWQHISPVWLVPLVALAVTLAVAWENYSRRGELINITFQNASGIQAGQTLLKYRDVTVGKVVKLGFTPGLKDVMVTLRVDKQVAPYIDSDSKFWVVRPQVSVRGISGLDTVLSGVYIAGSWDTTPGRTQTDFTGLEEPPLLGVNGQKGMRITLQLNDANQLSPGAPILYRGIDVGSVGTPRVSRDGLHVLVDALIKEPYTKYITSASRFWADSGFGFNIGPNGFTLNVKNLSSIVEGSVSFDTIVSGGQPVKTGQTFDLYATKADAQQSIFNQANQNTISVSAQFDASVSGLTPGADVRFKGLKIGEVIDLGAVVEGTGAARQVDTLVNMKLDVGRLGLDKTATEAEAYDLLNDLAKNKGLKAQLSTSSILTGAMDVELVEKPETGAAGLDMTSKPYPMLPSLPPDVSTLAASSQGLMKRISSLPVERLMNSAIGALDSIQALAADPKTRQIPDQAVGLLSDARNLITSPDIKKTLSDLSDTAASAKAMIQKVQQGQAIDNLMAAIKTANSTLDQIHTASEDFPQITAELKQLGQKLNTIPVQELSKSADQLVQSANALISTEGAKQLPESLSKALDQIRSFLG
ncbi:MCE family protein, partial [Thioclava sp. BHET1]